MSCYRSCNDISPAVLFLVTDTHGALQQTLIRMWSNQIKFPSHFVFWRHRDLMRPDSRCQTSASNHLSFVYGSRSHRLQGIPRPTGRWDTMRSGWFIAAFEELLEKPVWHQLQTRDPATARLHETGPSWIPYISGLFVASPCFVGEIHVGQPTPSPVSPDIFDIPFIGSALALAMS